jgi:hypothetical protein
MVKSGSAKLSALAIFLAIVKWFVIDVTDSLASQRDEPKLPSHPQHLLECGNPAEAMGRGCFLFCPFCLVVPKT